MGVLNEKRCKQRIMAYKIENVFQNEMLFKVSFIIIVPYKLNLPSSIMTTIGVPTPSVIAAANSRKITLDMLTRLQEMIDEFSVKVVEMEQELQTVKIENNILKNKIKELTAIKPESSQQRGLFGYGAKEFA